MKEEEFNAEATRAAEAAAAATPSYEETFLRDLRRWFEQVGVTDEPELEITHGTYEEPKEYGLGSSGYFQPTITATWEYAGYQYEAQRIGTSTLFVTIETTRGARPVFSKEDIGRALLEERDGLSASNRLSRAVCPAFSWMDPRPQCFFSVLTRSPRQTGAGLVRTTMSVFLLLIGKAMREEEFNELLIREAEAAAANELPFEERLRKIIGEWFERMGIDNPPDVAADHHRRQDPVEGQPDRFAIFSWTYAGHGYTVLADENTRSLDDLHVEVFTELGLKTAQTREQLGLALLEERNGLSTRNRLSRAVCPASSWMDPRLQHLEPPWSRPQFSVSFI